MGNYRILSTTGDPVAIMTTSQTTTSGSALRARPDARPYTDGGGDLPVVLRLPDVNVPLIVSPAEPRPAGIETHPADAPAARRSQGVSLWVFLLVAVLGAGLGFGGLQFWKVPHNREVVRDMIKTFLSKKQPSARPRGETHNNDGQQLAGPNSGEPQQLPTATQAGANDAQPGSVTQTSARSTADSAGGNWGDVAEPQPTDSAPAYPPAPNPFFGPPPPATLPADSAAPDNNTTPIRRLGPAVRPTLGPPSTNGLRPATSAGDAAAGDDQTNFSAGPSP